MIDLDLLTAWTAGVRAQWEERGSTSAGMLLAVRKDLPQETPSIPATVDALVAEDRQLRTLLARAARELALNHGPLGSSMEHDTEARDAGGCSGCEVRDGIVDLLALDPDQLI